MPLEQLLETLPEYAKDLKLNMGAVLRQTELTEQQTWGTAVACAMASRNATLLESILAEAAGHLSEQALFSAKTAWENAYKTENNKEWEKLTNKIQAATARTWPGRCGGVPSPPLPIP